MHEKTRITELEKQLEQEKEKFRKYRAYICSDYKLLSEFSSKYNFTSYSIEGFLQKIEELLDQNQASMHSIQTIKDYSNKLKNVTDFLDRERKLIFDDFELLQTVRQWRTEKNSKLKFFFEQEKEV